LKKTKNKLYSIWPTNKCLCNNNYTILRSNGF